MTNRNEDLLRRDADIAVRMMRPTQEALAARRIGVARIGLYAHQDYLQRFGTPKTLKTSRPIISLATTATTARCALTARSGLAESRGLGLSLRPRTRRSLPPCAPASASAAVKE